MSSLGDSQQLMPHGSDHGRGDEDEWNGDDVEHDWTDGGGGDAEDDSESVTSDPDIPAKSPSLGRPDDFDIAVLDTSEPTKQLLSALVAMFDSSSEPLQDGVNYALDILQMATEGKFLKQGKERYVKRALVFLKHIAEMEKASSRRNVPGTASGTILRVVLHQLGEFRSILDFYEAQSLVKRSARRSAIRFQYFDRLKSLRSLISCTEKHLGLGKVGKLHKAARHPVLRPRVITLTPVWLGIKGILDDAVDEVEETMEDDAIPFPKPPEALHLGFFLRTLQSSQTTQNALKRKRDGGLDQESSTPPSESDSAPFHERNQALATVKELSFTSLAFNDSSDFQLWKERASEHLFLMHDIWTSHANKIRMAPSYLMGVLTSVAVVFYQLYFYDFAECFCGLVVATIREVYESFPSDASRIHLCSALGAYTVVAVEADRDVLAVQAVEEAIALLHPLYMSDSSKHLLLMTALKITHSFALSNSGEKDPNAQPQSCIFRESARVACQAIDLARSTVEMDPTDLESKNMLAYALKAKANACNLLSHSCYDRQDRYARRRNEVEKTCARIGGSDDLIPLANKHSVTEYSFEKVVDKTLGDLDVAAAVLEQCIEVYWELAKKAKVLFEPILAKTIYNAATIYHSHLKPKPELCIAKFREAINIFERLSKHYEGYFDDRIEMANFDLARRLRLGNKLDEADLALGQMLNRRPSDGSKAAVKNWNGRMVEGEVFNARAMICVRMERYDRALAYAVMSYEIYRVKDPHYGMFAEPLAIQGFCRWVRNVGTAEEALRDLEKSVEEIIRRGPDYSEPRHLREVHYPVYSRCLVLGWLAGVQSALGQREEARRNGEKAVTIMRAHLSLEREMMRAEQALEPLEYVLPHLLVLLAGTHLQAGRYDEAKEAVEESLQVREKGVESSEGEKSQRMRADGPTRKTALLLKAVLLERDGLELEAEANRDEAEKIPFKGFLKVLGCSSAS
ncbi:hypothetical protein A4X13_0g3919 [Tilletia indica]|uniref:Uncharacterized protein n=1 Tax=Tilletia indica TaxID=43049 RepID=A0A177TI59_9BASI|nr:hypothetical protein A4X13_0g3919 [Tilletia indica]